MNHNYHVTFQQVEPEPIWLDLEGEHFPIYGNLAFFYKFFGFQHTEEWVQEQFRPWLRTAKEEWQAKWKKNGVSTPENAVRA